MRIEAVRKAEDISKVNVMSHVENFYTIYFYMGTVIPIPWWKNYKNLYENENKDNKVNENAMRQTILLLLIETLIWFQV